LMQASFRSMKPMLRSSTYAKHFTPPFLTMLLQMLGKISMRFVRHWMANTIVICQQAIDIYDSNLLLISLVKSDMGGLLSISMSTAMY
jgi:hypothetical protein